MKQLKLCRLALLTVLGVLVYHNILASPVSAGGFDAPTSTPMTEFTDCSPEPLAVSDSEQSNPTAKPQCQRKPRTLDWRYWSQPISQGNNLCREHLNGNTVCLTPTSAAMLRW